jgi:ribose transport system ATP-binding protein
MDDQYILRMEGITKEFPGVRALEGVHLELRKGEVLALIGENGAGKSTLMKILFGDYQPDAGRILLNGQEVHILNPNHAQALGISMVHQELNLVPDMNAAQNIALGHESMRGVVALDWPTIFKLARAAMAKVGVDVDIRVPVRKLSIAKRQVVEIAKALSWNAQILVMDEPTSSLTEGEINDLFHTMRTLRDSGVSMVFITHHIEEIFQIADRVLVLRDGKNMATEDASSIDTSRLIQMMVGRELNNLYPKEETRVEHLGRKGVLEDVSFSAFKGEILGIAGLVGAGRTELARAIFGADPIDAGKVYVEGREVHIQSPSDAIKSGLSLLTEDRKGQGLVLAMPVKHNIVLALIVLSIVISFLSPVFFTSTNLINIALQASINAIVAMGMTFVITAGGIDLSVGSIVGITGMVVADLLTRGTGMPIAAVAGLTVGLFFGCINGYLIAKFKLFPFVVTLGSMSILRGLALIYRQGRPIYGLKAKDVLQIAGYVGAIPKPVIIAVLAALLAYFIYNHTRIGEYTVAIGGNRASTSPATRP